jgi:hypothetical protein
MSTNCPFLLPKLGPRSAGTLAASDDPLTVDNFLTAIRSVNELDSMDLYDHQAHFGDQISLFQRFMLGRSPMW